MSEVADNTPIVLEPIELLGVDQIARTAKAGDAAALGRMLSKIGETTDSASLLARVLSKIGEIQ